MSDNKENKAIENNAMQRPGSAAMTPEITEPKEKETGNKAPLQDMVSPFKAAPVTEAPEKAEEIKPAQEAKSEPATKDASSKKKSKKNKKADAFQGMTEEEAEEEIRRQHKRRKRRTITLVMVVAVIAAGAILLPNLLKFVAPKVDISAINVNEQVLNYSVAKTNIVRDFTASGTLSAGETYDVKIAGDIEVDEFFVKNGDVISKGDKIASVSKSSVMEAIVEVQNMLKKVDKQLNKINSSDDETVIKADSDARVKKIYVKKGSNVEDTVTANGALILLSLDGLMAVDIERTENTKLGDSVTVVLSDKTKVSGSIISVNTNYVTCAISDKKAAYKEKVTVLDASGKEIGSSELYIHSVLPIIAYAGKVKTVSVKLNQTVEKGDKLLTLTGTKYSGEFSNLMYKRSVLEDQMQELFELYQTGIIYADHDGEIAGINEGDDEEEEDDDEDTTKSEKLSSATKKLGKLSIKVDDASSNPPDQSVDMSGVINYAVLVNGFNTQSGKTTYVLYTNSNDSSNMALGDVDYTNPSSEITNRNKYNYLFNHDYSFDSSIPIYTYDSTAKKWVNGSVSDLAKGDILIFTFSNQSNDPVWIIRYPQTSSGEQGGQGGQGGQGQGGQGQNGQGGQGGWNGGSFPGGRGSNFNWGSMFNNGNRGSYGGTGTGETGTNTEKKEETYEMDETLIASIVNLDTMSITLSVDELDVININSTQEVTITLDAVKDKSYTGKIVSIDTDGVRSGNGNAKYSVKIKLDRTEEMLTNMSASVRANISQAEVLSVPAEALIEKNNKTYVYTSYDQEKDELSGEVEIKTGISDGKNVEILSGLSEGDKIWYKYADGLVYKFVR